MKVYTIEEAAVYINDRLNVKWRNPEAAVESNYHRGLLAASGEEKQDTARTFTRAELNRFIREKNDSPVPRGGQAETDLSPWDHMFGYFSDPAIAQAAECDPMTVMRYRQRRGIANYRQAAVDRIKANAHRLETESMTSLAKELRVNRATIANFLRNEENEGLTED